jgi:ABC-type Fe3+-hydroxamate transport system substrate-binding protein
VKITDAIGREHARVDPARDGVRIVSLVPSITELLFDLGLAPWLVGRTGFCVHPEDGVPNVRSVPKIGGTKDVNIEKIRTLAPTHLIVNIDENEKPTVDRLAEFVPHVVVTHPNAPRDNLALYRLLGAIFSADDQAEALCARFEQAHAELKVAAAAARPQRVLYCIWKDPWMTVARDTYIARMLAEIGWQQVDVTEASGERRRYPAFAWSDRLVDGIDEVLLSSEPYRFTEEHVDALERQIGKPVRLLDGEMVSWYGSRAIQGLRYLRSLLA